MKVVVSFLLLFILGPLVAQQVQVCTKWGFIVPHNASMKGLMNHVGALEVGVFKPIDSVHIAYKNLNKPQFGYVAGGIRTSLQSTTGNCFYAGFSGRKNVSSSSRSFFGLQISAGLGYVSTPFNEHTNRQNIAIGSYLNGLMQVRADYNYLLSKKTALSASLDITHFSNANTRMPNFGFNFLLAGIGVKHTISNSTLNPAFLSTEYNRLGAEVMGKIANRQMTIDDRKNILMGISQFNLLYPQSPIAKWMMGLNYYYDRSYIHTDLQPLPTQFNIGKVSEFAISGGHLYTVGRIGLSTEIGVYLYRPAPNKRRYYEALGLRYYLNKNWFLNTRLKAHLATADYIEFGMGYGISTTKKLKPGFVNGWKYALTTGSFGIIKFKN